MCLLFYEGKIMRKTPLINLAILDVKQNDDGTISITIDVPEELKPWIDSIKRVQKWTSWNRNKTRRDT